MRLSISISTLAAVVLTLPLLLSAIPTPGPDIESPAGEPYPTTALQASNNSSNGIPLATFYTLWWFLLSLLPSWSPTFYGNYKTCYNLPSPFSFNTGSILPAPPSPGCWIYTDANCQGSYTVAGTSGIGIWSGDSRSFICDPPKVVIPPTPTWTPSPTWVQTPSWNPIPTPSLEPLPTEAPTPPWNPTPTWEPTPPWTPTPSPYPSD